MVLRYRFDGKQAGSHDDFGDARDDFRAYDW